MKSILKTVLLVLFILVVVLVACSIIWSLIKRLLGRIVPTLEVNQVVAPRPYSEAEALESDQSEASSAVDDDQWASAPCSHLWFRDSIPDSSCLNQTQFTSF